MSAAARSPDSIACAVSAASTISRPSRRIAGAAPSRWARRGETCGRLSMQPLAFGIIEDRGDDLGGEGLAERENVDGFTGLHAGAAGFDHGQGDGATEAGAEIARGDVAEAAAPGGGGCA